MTLPLVVHVITALELGGAQQNTLDTCRRLDRGRFRVALLTGPGGVLDAEAARIPDLDFRILRHLARPVNPLRDLRALWELRGHLRELQAGGPVVVHTHSSKAGVLGRTAARDVGIARVVHTIHGFGHPALRHAWMRALAIRTEQRLARHTDRFVVVSQANLDEGTRLGLFRAAPVRLIRSGFDLEPFYAPGITRAEARSRLGLPVDAPVIGTVACLKPQKAPEDFVRAAALVAMRVPDAHFVIAGDGELRDRVLRQARVLGLAPRLHLLGWRDDVPEILAALDVFWLTSRWEGLPRAVVQAMAAGVPVVATAADGTRDVVKDDVTGCLVDPGDVPAVAQRTIALLEDPDRRARLVRAARAIPEAFDVDHMTRELEGLYQELLTAGTPLRQRPTSADEALDRSAAADRR